LLTNLIDGNDLSAVVKMEAARSLP